MNSVTACSIVAGTLEHRRLEPLSSTNSKCSTPFASAVSRARISRRAKFAAYTLVLADTKAKMLG
jgi:hypothetical protein